jgi:hypothetical protein
MRPVAGIVGLVLGIGGCKVADAPDGLEDLVVFGFEHFDDKDAVVQQVADDLGPLLDRHADELESGFRVSNLTAAHLSAAGVEDANVEDVIGALGLVPYRHGLDDILPVLTRGDKADLFEPILAYDIEAETDRDCFLAHACDTLEQTVTETSKVTLLGEATRTYDLQYRWVERSDGGTTLLIRTLNPEPVELSSNIAKVHQQYALVAIFEDGRGAEHRAETFWVDAEIIGMDVPDAFAVDNAVLSMAAQAERIDAFLDGA